MYTYTYTAFIAFTFLMFPTGIPMHLTYQINAIHVCVYVCVCVCDGYFLRVISTSMTSCQLYYFMFCKS